MHTLTKLIATITRGSGAALLVALCVGISACSDDDTPPAPTPTATAQPTSTPTVPPTSTNTPTPTNTAEPTPTATTAHQHDEIEFGSTEPGGGSLNADYNAEHEHLDFDTCLGGDPPDCVGGIAVFSGDAPGYERVDEDMPDDSLYTLVDGTTVSLQIVEIDAGLSLRKDGATADAPGETLLLGTVPELDHTHVEYVVAVPGGTEDWEMKVKVRLRAAGDTYGPSEPVEIVFREAHGD